jgi:malate/lactate dehydrogenase
MLNRNGIREIFELPLDTKEMEDFQKSAAITKKVANSTGL